MKKQPLKINRRKTLMAMAGLWGAGLSVPSVGGPAPPAQGHPATLAGPVPGTPAGDPVEQALREDLARLGSRAYSDEGIPVFLACENMVAGKTGRPAARPSALSQAVASDLRKNGEAWLRLFPEAPTTDVSKVIEILAERDFSRGGRGEKS